jgi:uncharacterized phiE125 gp8 family phage protein
MTSVYTLITPPTLEPITLAEAKAQARITDTQSDSVIAGYIRMARDAAEQQLSRGLLTQTWRLDLCAWAETIWLPMAAPLQSVTSVKYYDNLGAQQTLATTVYDVDTIARPGRIVRAADQSWPGLQGDRVAGLIQITYVVGWSTPALVPARIKQGLVMYVAALEMDRDGSGTGAAAMRVVAESCWTDRVYTGAVTQAETW